MAEHSPAGPRRLAWMAAVAVVALAAVAVAVWRTQAPPSASPSAQLPAAAAAPAGAPAPGVALPTAASEGVALAGAPTTEAPHEEHEFVIQKDGDADKALALAVRALGGADKLEGLRNATLRHFALDSGIQFDGNLVHRGAVAVALVERDGAETLGLSGDTCWAQAGPVVVRCTRRQETLLYGLRTLHAATVLLPLQEPPYRRTGATVVEVDGRRFNVLQFETGQTDHVAELYLDTNTHLPMRLVVSRPERQSVRIDFDDVQMLGGARIATLRRIGLVDAKGGPFEPFSDRVTEVRPEASPAPLKPPPWTGELPLRISSRPALQVATFAAGTRAGFDAAAQAIGRDIARAEHDIQFVVYEALGRPDSAATLDAGVELWVAQADLRAVAPGTKVLDVPAELKVARRVRRLGAADVIPAFMAFVAEVRAAGHVPGPGRPLVRYHGEPDATGKVTAELQLPLEPTP